MNLPIVVASASFLLIFYVLAGYPLLLGALARRHRPFENTALSDDPPSVSVLLPVRNGELWIRRKLGTIAQLDYPKDRIEVIVISDGSTDATEDIVREFPGVELIRLPPRSKMAALNAGLERAHGEIVFFTDVRQELDPEALARLVTRFRDSKIGVVSGELRYRDPGGDRNKQDVGLYWRYEKWIRVRQSRIDSMIGATGCIYAMRRDLAGPMPTDLLLDDVYLPLRAFFRGYRTIMIEGAVAWDSPAGLNTEFRRKVRTLAGNYQILGMYPALLTPRNRMLFHFLSHKMGRLITPFALIALFASSWWLPTPYSIAGVSMQGAFYGAALLDRWLPDRSPLKRITSLASTFTVLMGATLCAASILFRPTSSFWKTPTNPAESGAPSGQ